MKKIKKENNGRDFAVFIGVGQEPIIISIYKTTEGDENEGSFAKSIKALIGGYFQCLTIAADYDCVGYVGMWVDDEGLIKHLPLNKKASKIANTGIVGNVLITGDVDDEGNTLLLTSEEALKIIKIMEM